MGIPLEVNEHRSRESTKLNATKTDHQIRSIIYGKKTGKIADLMGLIEQKLGNFGNSPRIIGIFMGSKWI
jgi:hypothetical protein